MANIYMSTVSFLNPPTRKTWRELRQSFPQIIGRVMSLNEAFEFPTGFPRAPGVVVITNLNPDPDEAAIITQATTHDGSSDPPLFGTFVRIVPNAAALPAMPPNIPTPRGFLAAVRNPSPQLYLYIDGAWQPL